jgi:ABC-type nitrate/sulfonate/bicarbonate transport system permease component
MALGGSYARTGATILLSLVPLTVLVVFWYCAMYFGSSYLQQFMPWPGETAMVFFELLLSGELIQHAISSIGRVLFGLTLASIVGIPLGILIGRFWTARSMFGPTFDFLRPIPIAAWVPLSIMLFGIGEVPAISLVFLGCLYPIVLNARDGVTAVDPIHLRAAGMLGAGPMQILLRVVLPSALPSIITGLRQALGIGWGVVILAELLAVRSGLGYLMIHAQQLWEPATIISCMIAVGVG